MAPKFFAILSIENDRSLCFPLKSGLCDSLTNRSWHKFCVHPDPGLYKPHIFTLCPLGCSALGPSHPAVRRPTWPPVEAPGGMAAPTCQLGEPAVLKFILQLPGRCRFVSAHPHGVEMSLPHKALPKLQTRMVSE